MSSLQTIGSGRRTQAPGALALVQQFLNTADIEAGTDAFATDQQARGWLRAHDLIAGGEPLDGAARRRLVVFREGLRDILTARAETGSSDLRIEPAESELARIAGDTTLTVRFDEQGGAQLVPAAPGTDGILGTLLAAIVAATTDGTWARLKICRNDACRWSFYDGSRNRSGHWCSMAICGNRMKGRAFRQRQGGSHAAS